MSEKGSYSERRVYKAGAMRLASRLIFCSQVAGTALEGGDDGGSALSQEEPRLEIAMELNAAHAPRARRIARDDRDEITK